MEPQNYHALSEEVYDPFAGEFDDETPPFDDPKAGWVVGSMWASAQCQRCRKASIWRDSVMVYPSGKGGPAPHPDMSTSAATLYEEARAVVPISRRAGQPWHGRRSSWYCANSTRKPAGGKQR